MAEMLNLQELEVAYSRGKQLVRVGDRFHDSTYGGDWEVMGFTGASSYSPSGFGGTPTIECRPLSGLPDYWKNWQKPNGNTDWCGDSVAAHIARGISTPVSGSGDANG